MTPIEHFCAEQVARIHQRLICATPAQTFTPKLTDDQRAERERQRQQVPAPRHGGTRRPTHKASEAQLEKMRALVAGGMKRINVARQMGFSRSYVSRMTQPVTQGTKARGVPKLPQAPQGPSLWSRESVRQTKVTKAECNDLLWFDVL